MNTRLLPTKFHLPHLRPDLVARPRLDQKLEQGFQAGSRLTLISAPAGYGKTTVAVAWLSRGAVPFAWITLDPEDGDPARFFAGLVAALQKIEPGLGDAARSLVELSQLPPAAVVVDELITDLASLQTPFVLALDDYHVIHSAYIHEALEYLIEHAPASLRLVVTTREDPPLSLARLRARGQLTELRVRDLRFTPTETSEFLVAGMGLDLPPDVCARLDRRVEGWAAGLQLAGLALQSEEDAAGWIDSFSGGHRYVIEYLLEEVLQRQPPELRAFLQRTAILERFNEDLCQMLIGPDFDARAILDRLERANLFLMPLDSNREWYRYHRLFSDVLRIGLDSNTEAALYARAAEWFEARDQADEAIHYHLAARQYSQAAALISAAAGEHLRRGEMRTLLRWIETLPLDHVLAMPDLAELQALCMVFLGHADRSARLLNKIESRPGTPGLARALAVRAWMMVYASSWEETIATAQRALDELEPGADDFFRILAMMALGTGYTWAVEDIHKASNMYRQAYALGQHIRHPFGALAALVNLIFSLLEAGLMPEGEALGLEAIGRYRDARGRPLPLLGLVYVPMSMLYLERCEYDQARAMAVQGLELCQKLFSSSVMGGNADQVLIETDFIAGNTASAFEQIDVTRQHALSRNMHYLTNRMILLEADLRLRLQDAPAARQVLDRLEGAVRDHQPLPLATYQLVWVRLLLQEGRAEEALGRLDELETGLREHGWGVRVIQSLVLRAACLHARGDRPAALAALEEAVRLAAPGGYRRSILRFSDEVLDLLPDARPVAPRFVDELLVLLGQPASTVDPQPVVSPTPTGPLSEQELKVLRLLAAGRTNQEIAAALYISAGTAKWHVHNVLEKLGASNRAQAAALAREHGLI